MTVSPRTDDAAPGTDTGTGTGTDDAAARTDDRATPRPPAGASQTPETPAVRLAGSVSMRRAVWALLRKELLVELRTLESVPGMSLFALSTFVVFHFALNRNSVDGDLAAGILWVTLLFAALLGVNRLFVADAEDGGFEGFLLAPVQRSAMLLSKELALLCYLVVLELVAVPAFALLLAPPFAHALPDLLLVLVLADIGVAVVGTLVAGLAVRTRARDLLGPLIGLPLLVPIVIGAARATSPLLVFAHAGAPAARWLATLALYDLLFGLIAYAVFDFLLED
jgi:heme exporter protein B